MKKAILAVLGVASLAVGFTVLTGFRGGGCGAGHRGDPAHMERMITGRIDEALEDLQATPEQRAKILAVKDRLLAEGKALHGARGDTRKEMLAQWDSASPDVARIHALIDQRAEAMKTLAHQAADGLAEVHAALTPEQRAQLSKKIHRRMDE